MGLLNKLSKSVSKTVSKGVNMVKSGIKEVNKDGISLNDKLNKIADKNQKELTKTPEEIRNEKLKELNDKLIAARSSYEIAPKAYTDAEKEYYVFKDGQDSYNSAQFNKYKKEADQVKTDMLQKHNEEMKDAFQSLSYYDSQRSFITNINEIKLNILSRIKHKLEEISNEYTDKNTNDRKTFYIVQEKETLTFWIRLFNHCMIAFAIIYVIFCVLEGKVNLFTYLFPIGIGIIVFYLETIFKLIWMIPMSFNVYTSWAEDNGNSMTTFFYIIGLSAVLYGIIKYNNDKIDDILK
jgi:hypothetical protein